MTTTPRCAPDGGRLRPCFSPGPCPAGPRHRLGEGRHLLGRVRGLLLRGLRGVQGEARDYAAASPFAAVHPQGGARCNEEDSLGSGACLQCQ